VVKVHVVHRRWKDDRVLARFARHLAERLGWGLGRRPERRADVNYWLAYYERGRFETFAVTRQAAYFTHVDDPEHEPDMVQLHHETAALVDLRVCMNRVDRDALAAAHGPTVAPPLPVELDHFRLKRKPPRPVPVIGFSGYGYRSGRKGGDLAGELVARLAGRCEFRASGRKWPCPTRMYPWRDVPGFFRGLDVYVSTATLEGGPMTTLEALASGVPVVIARDVGLHDELPDVPGIHRYRAGDADDLVRAVDDALATYATVDRTALRRAVAPHSVDSWCDAHRSAFERLVEGI
jgi:hypothetical protein